MITALQIILVLALISLIGIILGYLLGNFSCKKEDNTTYIERNSICEDSYQENLISTREEIAKEDNISTDIQKDLTATNTSVENNSDTVSVSSDNNSVTSNNLQENSTNNTIVTSTQPLITNSNSKESDTKDNIDHINAKSNKETNHAIEKENNNTINQDFSSTKENLDTNEDNTKKQDFSNIKENLDNSKTEEKTINADTNKDIQTEKPLFLTEAKDGKADNLCRIKGIGRVIEEKLHNLGVFHFEQIASWTEKETAWVDEHLSFKGRILREDWIGQAKILASGKETEFSKRVDKGEVQSSKKS